MGGFYEESSSSVPLQSVTPGSKAISRKGKGVKAWRFIILSVHMLVLFVFMHVRVCERLLMDDDKDLGSFEVSAVVLYFWFLNITLSRGEERRGSKMSWLG